MPMHRRSFVKYASLAAAGNLAGLRPFGALNALAQTSTDYKALVCIFLFGGNDANNMVIPFDASGYANYAALRSAGGSSLALAQNTLLPLTPLPNFALHPSLPEIQTLFNSGAAALVANVGTLIQPTTRAQFLAGSTVPSNLFSHPDQQEEWQNASQDGSVPTGWAGRVSDLLTGSFNPSATIPMITSVAGDTLFCNGVTTTPVSVAAGNVGTGACSEGSECSARQAAAQSLISFNSGVSLITQDDRITSNAYKYSAILTAATQSVTPLKTAFPATGLGAQLAQIAQIIQVRAALGVTRQIFFAGIGNFDTHSNQLALQAALLSQISPAMLAFYQATQEMMIPNQVTSFTMSDFARAFQPNSNSGTDHAWGSHHIVFGGAVKGGQMYGKFPTIAFGGPDDSGSNGRWVPSTGSVQYASTLAQWFGVPAAQLSSIFPNIGGFSTNNLGFV
ncbi:MAG: DUF1501 domain-containing protein [Bryocella sp.]